MIVKPKDNGKVLNNPGMGWFLAYYTDNVDTGFGVRLKDGDTLNWFPGCNGVSFRIGWGRVEPQEGKYNWDYTDKIAQKWIAAGKQVGFNWIVFSTAGTPPSTPVWLRDKGAKGREYSGNKHFVPNWDDPVFMQEFDSFLKEAGRRYNGKPYVAFVEVGSLGTWGEGHFWVPSGEFPPIPTDVKIRHLEMYRRHFPDTPLHVNDDFISTASDPARVMDTVKRLGFGIADWSIAVNHRNFEPAARYADPVWRERPILLEHHHYGDAVNKGWWGDGSELYRAMERFHASQMRIHWFPDEFLNGDGKDLKGNKSLVDRINQRIGYRLQILQGQWPDAIAPGQEFNFAVRLRNAGVAPCYRGGFPAITIKDGDKIIWSGVGTKENLKELPPGSTADRAEVRDYPIPASMPRVKPGRYAIYFSVANRESVPLYNLPLDNDDGEKRYRLGEMEISG